MRIQIDLPVEFVELCASHNVKPKQVLRGFIADLCGLVSYASNPRPDGYSSNGSDERMCAQAYYERCGYEALARWAREAEASRPTPTKTRRLKGTPGRKEMQK